MTSERSRYESRPELVDYRRRQRDLRTRRAIRADQRGMCCLVLLGVAFVAFVVALFVVLVFHPFS
jgi:hypothetical protein